MTAAQNGNHLMQTPVVVALDYPSEGPALALAAQLSPELCRLKIGKELFTRCGPALVEKLQALGFEIFLDLKFHDIPNTVARAVSAPLSAASRRSPKTTWATCLGSASPRRRPPASRSPRTWIPSCRA